jgi:hypothetical protein
MSRERSYFEHNGMPLYASPKAGRLRHMQEQWLGLFTAHPAQPAEQQPLSTTGVVMPEPSNDVTGMNGEAEGSAQLSASELPAAPSLLQRAATDTTGVPSTSVTQSTNQQQFTSAAQPNQPNAAVSSAMRQPAIPVNVRHVEPAHGAELKSSGGPEGESANLLTGGASLPGDAPDAVPLSPRVLVQKHLTIQTEISSMSAASGPAATSLPGGVIVPLTAPMGPSISPAGEAGEEPGETLTSNESFSAAVIPAAVPVRFARTPMGASNIPIGNIRQASMPESQPQNDRSQQALLDRLNDRAAPPQHAGGNRRVHIGNLRITVQRPAMAAAQTPSSAPLPQPQAATDAGQTLFNPWERHYMAFD